MDTEAKKLFDAKAWAIDAPSNRAEIDDPNVTPQIDRGQGWDVTFSQAGGNLPDRRHFNQILCEMFSAALLVKEGVSLWDADIDYPIHAITNTKGTLWRAKVATGPATSNAVNPETPNQNVWEQTGQSRAVPDAPEAFLGATPAHNTIVAQWKSGEDNGAKITSWEFQIAVGTNEDWSSVATETVQYPYVKKEGLEAGTQYKVRARGRNLIGLGEWGESTVGATGFTTTGTVPGGGNIFGLLATAGDGEVDLEWTAPDDGGYPILRYTVQWAESDENFDVNQQTTTGSLETTVDSLTNGQEYKFRVKATNLIGDGDWSNIATATPKTSVVVVYQPTLSAPTLSVQSTTRIDAQPNEQPSALGKTAAVTSYIWEHKKQGLASWSSAGTTTSKSFPIQNLEASTTYDIRYKVTTSEGTTDPSPSATATTQTPEVPVVAKVQPRLRSPSASSSSSGRTAYLTSRHYTETEYPLYNINSTIWQYRKVGTSSWTTYSGTGRSVNISVDLTRYSYTFRFAYKTDGGTTGFSPTATLAKKRQTTTSPSPSPSNPAPTPSRAAAFSGVSTFSSISGNNITKRVTWSTSFTGGWKKTQIRVNHGSYRKTTTYGVVGSFTHTFSKRQAYITIQGRTQHQDADGTYWTSWQTFTGTHTYW